MPPSSKLLRVPRPGNKEPPFILLHVSASSEDSLSLTLRATEGERAFGTSLERSGLDACRQKSFNGTLDELEAIFHYLFLGAPADTALVRGAELAAVIHGTGIQLSVRKDVGGIKQKLAQLAIPEAEVEIPIFEWAAESCAALESLSNETSSQQSQKEKQQTTIEKLTQQVETLTTTKKEHEEMLLIKFKILLNEKKAKIRELDRLVGRAETGNSVDKEKDKVTVEAKAESPPAKRGRSTRGKKAAAPRTSTRTTRKRRQTAVSPSNSDDDGGPAQMEIDSPLKSPTTRTTRTVRQNKGKTTVVASPPELESVEDDATASDDDLEPQMSDSRTSEDELPPMRKPMEFFTKPATVEPTTKSHGQETSDRVKQPGHSAESDEDDEL